MSADRKRHVLHLPCIRRRSIARHIRLAERRRKSMVIRERAEALLERAGARAKSRFPRRP